MLTLLRSCFFASVAYNAPSMRPGLENSTFSKMDIIVIFYHWLLGSTISGETERRVTREPIGNRESNGIYSPSTARRGNLKAQFSFSGPAYRVLCTNQSREQKLSPSAKRWVICTVIRAKRGKTCDWCQSLEACFPC